MPLKRPSVKYRSIVSAAAQSVAASRRPWPVNKLLISLALPEMRLQAAASDPVTHSQSSKWAAPSILSRFQPVSPQSRQLAEWSPKPLIARHSRACVHKARIADAQPRNARSTFVPHPGSAPHSPSGGLHRHRRPLGHHPPTSKLDRAPSLPAPPASCSRSTGSDNGPASFPSRLP